MCDDRRSMMAFVQIVGWVILLLGCAAFIRLAQGSDHALAMLIAMMGFFVVMAFLVGSFG